MDKRKYCGYCGKLLIEKGPISIEKWDIDADRYDKETGKKRFVMYIACPDYKRYDECWPFQNNWQHNARSLKIILK